MDAFDFKRLKDENERQYIWRICSAKGSGLIELSWEDVARIINDELYGDSDLQYTESVYRKSYHTAKAYYDDVFCQMSQAPVALRQLEEKHAEIDRATKRLQDQRREYKKLQTLQARMEHLHDTIVEIAQDLNKKLPLLQTERKEKEIAVGETNAVLFLSDWHYGMTTDNLWGKYNTDICAARAKELVEKTIEYLKRHHVGTLHVVLLGDALAGAIHVGTRIEAEEAVCEQLIHVSELFAEVIDSLAPYVEDVKVYSTYGNHSRTVQKFSDSIHRDNMERIIGWWLKERLSSHHNNITVLEESKYGELIHVPVCGYNLIASHGDLDNFKDVGTYLHTIFTQKYGIDVHHVVIGHWHRAESIERLGIHATIAPAMCGPDEYAHTKRLYSDAAQMLMMFTPDSGCECVYTIKFSR